jgi:hypothetical protein
MNGASKSNFLEILEFLIFLLCLSLLLFALTSNGKSEILFSLRISHVHKMDFVYFGKCEDFYDLKISFMWDKNSMRGT